MKCESGQLTNMSMAEWSLDLMVARRSESVIFLPNWSWT